MLIIALVLGIGRGASGLRGAARRAHGRMGRFSELGNVLTLVPIADASVSRKGGDENCGDSKRLYVANNGGGELKSLLPFDLVLVTESFGPVIGFRKMARGD